MSTTPRFAGTMPKLRPRVNFPAMTRHMAAPEITAVNASGSSPGASPVRSSGGPTSAMAVIVNAASRRVDQVGATPHDGEDHDQRLAHEQQKSRDALSSEEVLEQVHRQEEEQRADQVRASRSMSPFTGQRRSISESPAG